MEGKGRIKRKKGGVIDRNRLHLRQFNKSFINGRINVSVTFCVWTFQRKFGEIERDIYLVKRMLIEMRMDSNGESTK